MKHISHFAMCLVLIGVAALAYLFIPSIRSLGWFGFMIVICPLMHIIMMKGGKHQH